MWKRNNLIHADVKVLSLSESRMIRWLYLSLKASIIHNVINHLIWLQCLKTIAIWSSILTSNTLRLSVVRHVNWALIVVWTRLVKLYWLCLFRCFYFNWLNPHFLLGSLNFDSTTWVFFVFCVLYFERMWLVKLKIIVIFFKFFTWQFNCCGLLHTLRVLKRTSIVEHFVYIVKKVSIIDFTGLKILEVWFYCKLLKVSSHKLTAYLLISLILLFKLNWKLVKTKILWWIFVSTRWTNMLSLLNLHLFFSNFSQGLLKILLF